MSSGDGWTLDGPGVTSVLGIQDYEEILTRLASASNAEVAQVVHRYRGRRRGPHGDTTEITIELLRGPAGFTIEAWTEDGRRARSGEPSWDLAVAITATDWSGLDAPITRDRSRPRGRARGQPCRFGLRQAETWPSSRLSRSRPASRAMRSHSDGKMKRKFPDP